MVKIIGACGNNCTQCDVYIATVNNDDKLRSSTAEAWSKIYSQDIKPDSINCKSCQQNEVLFYFCDNCDIRDCAHKQGIKICAECERFICEELEGLIHVYPEVGENLKVLRDEIKKENN